MAMTGDWTVVNDDANDVDGGNKNNKNNNDDDNDDDDEDASESSDNLETFVPPDKAAVRFPCSEQPPRFALRSRNGFYLCGTRKGRLLGRKKRTEQDEWSIAFSDVPRNDDIKNDENADSRAVTLHHHKFGGILSLVNSDSNDLGRIAACITPPQQQQQQQQRKPDNAPTEEDVPGDLGLGEDGTDDAAAAAEETTQERLPDDEEEEGDDDDEDLPVDAAATAEREDLEWSIVPCSGADHPNGGVTLVAKKTGDRLGITDRGKPILCAAGAPVPSMITYVWELQCVTGELCFLHNPSVDARVRCDMAGLLTLSPNWKGWEVVRITEASSAPYKTKSENNGYVRISSWMHSQWFLCSDATGVVGTCSVAESLAPPPATKELARTNGFRCSLWAIEKHQSVDSNQNAGVILRSVTHDRLLSLRDGVLRTYDPNEEAAIPDNSSSGGNDNESAIVPSDPAPGHGGGDGADPNFGDVVKQRTDGIMRGVDEMRRKSNDWWRQSLTNVQKTMTDAAMNRRHSTPFGLRDPTAANAPASPREEETVVWQLEAAHSQTYYFVSVPAPSASSAETVPRSIGPFPSVTDNLRKSDKIQFIRNEDGEDPDSLKLYLPEERYYVSCSAKGSIAATKQEDDESTQWILEDRPDGSVFRSKQHGLYLSWRDVPEEEEDAASGGEPVPPAAAFADGKGDEKKKPEAKASSNPFENLQKLLPHQKKKIPMAELCATPTVTTVWKLEPCTPRAISSKRLKTFAIGTSIAVGTTIAMPFALAGVAAAMGALGAEAGIGFGIVAAAATGAEALASVGAIGATAYFCFRPEQNSLGGPSSDGGGRRKEEERGSPWSNRPFSNWRNW